MKNLLITLILLCSTSILFAANVKNEKIIIYIKVIEKLKSIKVGDPLKKATDILGKLPTNLGSGIQTYYYKDSMHNSIIVDATLENTIISIRYQRDSTDHKIEQITKKKKP